MKAMIIFLYKESQSYNKIIEMQRIKNTIFSSYSKSVGELPQKEIFPKIWIGKRCKKRNSSSSMSIL